MDGWVASQSNITSRIVVAGVVVVEVVVVVVEVVVEFRVVGSRRMDMWL